MIARRSSYERIIKSFNEPFARNQRIGPKPTVARAPHFSQSGTVNAESLIPESNARNRPLSPTMRKFFFLFFLPADILDEQNVAISLTVISDGYGIIIYCALIRRRR